MDLRPARRRLFLPIVVAVVLAAESAGGAFAVGSAAHSESPTPVPADQVERATASAVAAVPAPDARHGASDRSDVGFGGRQAADDLMLSRRTLSAAGRTVSSPPASPAPAAPAPAATQAPTPKPAATYRGKNHVWIPSLGISRSVEWFPCTRSKPPGHQMYRWGCAGASNVYLFAHAATVFKPLHDAYVKKRLRKGMEVVYADKNGTVRRYVVSYWKVVRPDGDIGWAYAAQSRPSMTLQTCVGAKSELRLVVRLVAKG